MRIEIPELCVVALIGASGCGKSTFAAQHFKPTEVLASDYFRALVSDDESNQKVTRQAFDALYYVATKRLELGLLSVIDATNVQKDARSAVLGLAKEQDCFAVAIVLNIPEQVCQQRNLARCDRQVPEYAISQQSNQLRRSIKALKKEGFRYVYILNSVEDIEEVEIVRTRSWNNKTGETGPFDVIGDVHGCYDELCDLLIKLGYVVDRPQCIAEPPGERRAIFVGDLCDRGPNNVEVLRLVIKMVAAGTAYCVAGNHDVKLLKHLRGSSVAMTHGLDITIGQLAGQGDEFIAAVIRFLDGLISHYVFDDGNLVVAHAGLIEKYQGRSSGRVRSFCLYGDTTGETDEYGLPVRLPWADHYRGRATVVYGHTPTTVVEPINNTYCIDTGCVFGGRLTGLRYPEKEIVQVEALRQYAQPIRPLQTAKVDLDLLSIDDVIGERIITTRLRPRIKINAENTSAALEVMSRFAADPHWLIYLPPTMSPCETSPRPDYLEHPDQAFEYYRSHGVTKVVCEQKHMGSRAVMIVGRDQASAKRRFQSSDNRVGIIYTRTGRNFFDEDKTEQALLTRLQLQLTTSGFWDDFDTDWVCLDTELMPWSAKALGLIETQYAPVGRAGRSGLESALGAISKAAAVIGSSGLPVSGNTVDLFELQRRYEARLDALTRYAQAYGHYCWDISSVDDYRIAAFHLLATAGHTWTDQNHIWHMDMIAKYLTGVDPVFIATDHRLIDLTDETGVADGVAWWEELTTNGGEGMVVKPYDFIAHADTQLLQPAIKCRGREYLRIIYGAEYLLADNLSRLKNRSLSKKRALALNEFGLSVESLERFVGNQPLSQVHEPVFAVLALESEPVDPRL